ncbi:hypothetical protein [Lysobacter capsici]|uniref:hypothetical protein n=1 Tax=Lysobacter capsici TaxID=435897 RepID=UPI000A6E0AFD|nr:hypothetical protein [Lysobacter capsici]
MRSDCAEASSFPGPKASEILPVTMTKGRLRGHGWHCLVVAGLVTARSRLAIRRWRAFVDDGGAA